MRKQRSFNFEMASFGLPGSGKTEYTINHVIEMQRREQFYIVAHDAGYSIPKKLWNGKHTGVVRYSSAKECAVGIKEMGGGGNGRPPIIHCITSEDAAETVEFGKKLGEASLLANSPGGAQQVEDGEGRGIPVIVVVDEITRSKDASPYRLEPAMAQMIALRRHFNCGFVFTSQSPHLCHYALGTQATDIVVFRLNDDEDVKRLYKRMNMPRPDAERAKTLGKHEFIHFKPGDY